MRSVAACVILAAVGSAIVGLTGGCGSTMEKQSPEAAHIDLLMRNWKLDWIDGQPFSAEYPGHRNAPTIRVERDGRVTGFTGVNHFNGTLDPEPMRWGGFHLSPLAMTRMAGPPAEMELERHFLRLLNDVERYTVTADSLALGIDDRDLLRFVPAR